MDLPWYVVFAEVMLVTHHKNHIYVVNGKIKSLLPTYEAISQKELESYQKGALEIINTIFYRLRMFE